MNTSQLLAEPDSQHVKHQPYLFIAHRPTKYEHVPYVVIPPRPTDYVPDALKPYERPSDDDMKMIGRDLFNNTNTDRYADKFLALLEPHIAAWGRPERHVLPLVLSYLLVNRARDARFFSGNLPIAPESLTITTYRRSYAVDTSDVWCTAAVTTSRGTGIVDWFIESDQTLSDEEAMRSLINKIWNIGMDKVKGWVARDYEVAAPAESSYKAV